MMFGGRKTYRKGRKAGRRGGRKTYRKGRKAGRRGGGMDGLPWPLGN
jgi:hypothetical protein